MPSRSSSSSRVDPQLLSLYQNEYGNAQSRNDQTYQQILAAFNQQQQQTQRMTNQIQGGYGRLSDQVLSRISGIGRSKSQDIADAFAQQSGSLSQQMVNSGLGNTTVQGSMQRGLTLDAQKAQINLSEQIAQMQAQYQSQLGQGGLQAQQQGLGFQNQGTNQLMGALAGFRTPYPNMNLMTQQNQSSSVDPIFGGGRGGGGGPGGGMRFQDWSGSTGNRQLSFNQTAPPGIAPSPMPIAGGPSGSGWDGGILNFGGFTGINTDVDVAPGYTPGMENTGGMGGFSDGWGSTFNV